MVETGSRPGRGCPSGLRLFRAWPALLRRPPRRPRPRQRQRRRHRFPMSGEARVADRMSNSTDRPRSCAALFQRVAGRTATNGAWPRRYWQGTLSASFELATHLAQRFASTSLRRMIFPPSVPTSGWCLWSGPAHRAPPLGKDGCVWLPWFMGTPRRKSMQGPYILFPSYSIYISGRVPDASVGQLQAGPCAPPPEFPWPILLPPAPNSPSTAKVLHLRQPRPSWASGSTCRNCPTG